MKVLRCSCYPPNLEPLTTVMRDVDLTVGIRTAAERSKILAGAFVATEIFAMDEGGIEEATEEALVRLERKADRERNAAILYHWSGLQLPRLEHDGVLTGTLPAPLNSHEVVSALTQLAEHPNYQSQTVMIISEDMELVLMRNGKCEVKDLDDDTL